jgi:alkylhydroperoxidase family enzyme
MLDLPGVYLPGLILPAIAIRLARRQSTGADRYPGWAERARSPELQRTKRKGESMARIQGLSDDEVGFVTRRIFRMAAGAMGRVPDPLRIMARSGGTMWGAGLFQTAFERADRVDRKLKTLACLKAASLIGCVFWLDINSAVGKEEGITEAQLRDLSEHASSDVFSPLEKRVLDYAVALSRTPATVSDELFSALRTDFDEEQLVELTAMISWENFRARFNRGFDVAEQGYSEGAFCAIPERHEVRWGLRFEFGSPR